ncbi:MAG: hypothetical protein ACOX3W_04735 [Christensenellaceae bacterium]
MGVKINIEKLVIFHQMWDNDHNRKYGAANREFTVVAAPKTVCSIQN